MDQKRRILLARYLLEKDKKKRQKQSKGSYKVYGKTFCNGERP